MKWRLCSDKKSKSSSSPSSTLLQTQPYTLGLSPYKRKTFKRTATSNSNDDTLPDSVELEELLQKELITTTTKQQRSPFWKRISFSKTSKQQQSKQQQSTTTKWDYGQAIEGDNFYNISLASAGDDENVDDDEDQEYTVRQRMAQLTSYCPKVFTDLRSIFGISEEQYLKSVLASGPFVSFQSNSKGAARTGTVFFFTRDGSYMIKTIKQEEAQTLLQILPKYHRHMKHNKQSLLTRFCGMYGIQIEEEENDDDNDTSNLAPTGKFLTFVVMNAVFPPEANQFISERFDLKGSTVGRAVSEEELQSKGSNAVLKDLDLSNEVDLIKSKNGKEYGITLGVASKSSLLAQLRKDVKLLVDCNVMDYSLLVGIVHMDDHHKNDIRNAITTMNQQDRIFDQIEYNQQKRRHNNKLDHDVLYILSTPVRLILSPPTYLARKAWNLMRLTVDSIFTTPLPYYGSGTCGVDGGKLSVFHGKRRGDRAIYYMGLIDFLQPWTTRKVIERQLKGLIGYDTKAISSVTPEEYASRFLDYMDANIS